MKRNLKYLSVLVALLLVVTGCSLNKDPKTKVLDAIEKVENAKSFNFELKGDLSLAAQGVEVTGKASITGEVLFEDYGPSIHYRGNVSIPLLGDDQDVESYVIATQNGKLYTYEKEQYGWTREITDYENKKFSLKELKDAVEKAKSIEKAESERSGYTKYVVTISSDDVNGTLTSNGADAVLGDTKLTDDIKVNVYLKGGYVGYVEVDLSDTLSKLMAESTSNSSDVSTSAKISLYLEDFNKMKAMSIPGTIVEIAKDKSDASNE